MLLNAQLPLTLLSRIEDAGLNASAPPQQRWIDGWLVRFCPGKAKRARCVNAVAEGQLPLEHRLDLCRHVLEQAQLPFVVRITPFSQPPTLDQRLDALGLQTLDDTRVMVCANLSAMQPEQWPAGLTMVRLGHAAFAQTVGQMRGSPISQQQAHAQRLELSPVPFEGWALRRRDSGRFVACGQFAVEADMVGLYDIFTAEAERGKGLSRQLCAHLLTLAGRHGARCAYLQVDAGNLPARAVYQRLGFEDAYAYHYRTPVAARA